MDCAGPLRHIGKHRMTGIPKQGDPPRAALCPTRRLCDAADLISPAVPREHTPDLAEYYKIDHDYPVEAAKIAKQNGARAVFLVTAVGADASSGVFYLRTKGAVERDVTALDFAHTHIFRPSMILGQRTEH